MSKLCYNSYIFSYLYRSVVVKLQQLLKELELFKLIIKMKPILKYFAIFVTYVDYLVPCDKLYSHYCSNEHNILGV